MWTSKTGQFGSEELGMLEKKPSGELIPMLIASAPLVVLRALIEIMQNGDETKLAELLHNQQVNQRWRSYFSDFGVGEMDHEYARQILKKLA